MFLIVQVVLSFINTFFEQNPISQIELICTRNKRADCISELSGVHTLRLFTVLCVRSVFLLVLQVSYQLVCSLTQQSTVNSPLHFRSQVTQRSTRRDCVGTRTSSAGSQVNPHCATHSSSRSRRYGVLSALFAFCICYS